MQYIICRLISAYHRNMTGCDTMEWYANRDAIAAYMQAIYVDGDWLNDWLTHMTPIVAAFMRNYGMSLAASLGF
jgi:DNA-binding phage protein